MRGDPFKSAHDKSAFCDEWPDYNEARDNPKCLHGVRWSHYSQCATCTKALKRGLNHWLAAEAIERGEHLPTPVAK